uniref:Thiazole synthase n=1 Tax=Dictyopteris divaricata TaxID=156996 RepID=A0A2I4Q2C1_9PHAE|nr:thiamine biosynthesis protein G [Dictyopteris divaricata]YP_010205277.1 thiamine biosynthesis protein G [Grateloupia livida]AQZ24988.1 thiamine biosynthesis protein G [Dictyopteris divaricata]UAV85846.1 thiamine biosynthesis protein G [Grateloupia livida]
MIKTDTLTIGNKIFNSRLLIGTGKYHSLIEMLSSITESESEIITVAVRRLNLLNLDKKENLLFNINWKDIWLLPNTAGAKTTEDAIRLAFLGRELAKRLGQTNNNFIKLEVISDSKYLLPDPIGTLKAAEFLVKKGFIVLPYTNADPILAKHLEDVGCSTIMPLGSPIGSGQGIQNKQNIEIIIENSRVPVIIDAGIRSPSEAAFAMEMGADAVLINTAIAQARNPLKMAKAMNLAVAAGREAFLAGPIPSVKFAQSSSSIKGSAFLV